MIQLTPPDTSKYTALPAMKNRPWTMASAPAAIAHDPPMTGVGFLAGLTLGSGSAEGSFPHFEHGRFMSVDSPHIRHSTMIRSAGTFLEVVGEPAVFGLTFFVSFLK